MLEEVVRWSKKGFTIIVCIILLEKFVFGFTIVQGMSMQPTLHNNDKLFINKLAYTFSKPEYGDIVIFHPPIHEREKELFIKRIIATQGDRFLIQGDKIYINDQLLKEPYIYHEAYTKRFYRVTSGVVPKGMIFVMGDNRNDSNDSRCFGFVPQVNIEGKADFRIWPVHSVEAFSLK